MYVYPTIYKESSKHLFEVMLKSQLLDVSDESLVHIGPVHAVHDIIPASAIVITTQYFFQKFPKAKNLMHFGYLYGSVIFESEYHEKKGEKYWFGSGSSNTSKLNKLFSVQIKDKNNWLKVACKWAPVDVFWLTFYSPSMKASIIKLLVRDFAKQKWEEKTTFAYKTHLSMSSIVNLKC